MTNVINFLIPFGLAAVSLVLLAGLINMVRPSKHKGQAASRSQQLMRWRVALQFITIIVVMLGFYLW